MNGAHNLNVEQKKLDTKSTEKSADCAVPFIDT